MHGSIGLKWSIFTQKNVATNSSSALINVVCLENNWGRAGYPLNNDLVATSRAKKLTIFKNLTDGQLASKFA